MTKAKLTFEQALDKLEAIVAEIEEGKVPLEESIAKYAEGTRLVAQCRSILDRAEEKIKLLGKGAEGEMEENRPEGQT